MDRFTVLVTGAKGQLGFDTVLELRNRGICCIASDIGEPDPRFGAAYVSLDITDRIAVFDCIEQLQPQAVIHCAAWTAVDAAEEIQNREKVYAINVRGTENIARACRKIQAKLLYISTDYVFNGGGQTPWDADSLSFSPLNYYGETKLAGEFEVSKYVDRFFIVRTSWVFGLNGGNFVKTMLNVGQNRDSVRVVCDQIGAPTYTADLAVLLVNMIQTEKYGRYHATNSGGYISWFDFCCEIYRIAGLNTEVHPVTTAEYGASLAKRPYNIRLDLSKLQTSGFPLLPDWTDALERYITLLWTKKELL